MTQKLKKYHIFQNMGLNFRTKILKTLERYLCNIKHLSSIITQSYCHSFYVHIFNTGNKKVVHKARQKAFRAEPYSIDQNTLSMPSSSCLYKHRSMTCPLCANQ